MLRISRAAHRRSPSRSVPARGRPRHPRGARRGRRGAPVNALRAVLGSRHAAFVAVLLAGLAACQGVELARGASTALPPPPLQNPIGPVPPDLDGDLALSSLRTGGEGANIAPAH